MKNIMLIIEYLGTNYCGFQKQTNGLSIQTVLEEAIFKAIGEHITLYPSGRTDAGVHALGQTANFHTNTTVPADKLPIVINFNLPKDIRVIKSIEVDKTFHARKSAKSKTYIYRIFNTQTLSVFHEDRALPYGYKIDINLMQQACKKIVGTHDFSSFVSTGATTKTTTRTIFDCSIEKQNDEIIFSITGNGFLYNMVRILVGTILEIGANKMPLENLDTLLQGNHRNLAGKTVKPDGLYLKEVIY